MGAGRGLCCQHGSDPEKSHVGRLALLDHDDQTPDTDHRRQATDTQHTDDTQLLDPRHVQ